MYDRILFFFLSTNTGPHTDTWSACIGKNGCTDLIENVQETITLNGVANLL